MRLIARSSALLLTLAGGCLSPPDDTGGIVRITAEPRQDALRADGHGMADIRIEVDDATRLFRRPVEVRVSSGTLGVGDSGRAPFIATTPANGIIELPLRYGRAPGPVYIEARTGGQVFSDDALVLEPQRPDGIDLSADATEIIADGIPRPTLTIGLFVTTPGALPSYGVRVELRACCADVDGDPAPCLPGEIPPLRVPPRVTLAEGGDLSAEIDLRIAAEPVDAVAGPDLEPRLPFTAFIAAATHGGPPPCVRPESAEHAVIAFRIRPR